MSEIPFYLIASMTIASAYWVVVSSRLIYSAIALLFTLFGIAGLYIILYADFLAASQVIVYVGGILVLIIFGVMLTTKISDVSFQHSSRNQMAGSFFALGIFSLIITVAMRTEWPEFELTSIEGTTEILGKMILTEYLLPFEAVSVLLLSALIGAAMLSRRGDS
tara:strand:- start:65 stop:556 length:492 start_codon:yes stop_codon:yes gene_type:complete